MPVIETKGALSSQGYGEFAQSGASPVYVEDVFSTTLYTGNGLTNNVNAGIPLGRFPTVFQENYSTDINAVIKTSSGDWVLVYIARAGSAPTCTINGSSVTASSTLTDSAGFQYGMFIAQTSSSTTTITSSALNFAMALVIRGPSGVSVATNLTQVSGTSFFTGSVSSAGWGLLFLTDRDPAANPTINTDDGTFMRTNIGNTNGAIYGINGTGSAIPSRTVSSLDASTPTIYCVLSATGAGTTVATAGPAAAGGMVWIKSRSAIADHALYDTARGATLDLVSNSSAAQTTQTTGLKTFNSNGFSVGTLAKLNTNNAIYTSWAFREQPKFFDVVTYTGNGVSNRTIAHNLGSVPGCIIVKRLSGADGWAVWHRSLSAGNVLELNLAATQTALYTTWFGSNLPTSTVFNLGTDTRTNGNGSTYVAYLFAHDAGGFGATGTDNVITCGSYTGTGADPGPTITLGYEPQWVLIKVASGSANDWILCDNLRGSVATAGGSSVGILLANDQAAEGNLISGLISPSATGFTIASNNGRVNQLNSTYIYIAIRRGPMKTPTTGASVFQPVVYTGTNVDNRLVTTGILTDFIMARQRNSSTVNGFIVGDRLRGDAYLATASSGAAVNDPDSLMTPTLSYGNAFSAMNGFGCGNDPTSQLNASTLASNQVVEAFSRAPGFLDVVAYTGTGVARTINHNLGVVPQMMWVKNVANTVRNWAVYFANSGASAYVNLNQNAALTTGDTAHWNGTAPTSTVFSVGTSNNTNQSANAQIAYLMGNVTGVSRVSYYVGRGVGTSHQVDCGFTSGARMVLIKSVNATGSWYLWDSARGIVAGNDPYLFTNSPTAEVTSTDYVDSFAGGFEISSTAIDELNNGYANVITSNSAGRAEEDGIYDGTRFLGITTSLLYQSTDGLSWTSAAHGVTNARCIGYNGTNLYVIGGNSGGISTSTDRTTWTPRTSGTANPLLGVTYGFGKWWMCGGSGTILSSTDGITWSSVTSGVAVTLEDIKFVNGILLAVGASGTIVKSTDGVTFTSTTLPVGTLNGIAYGNSLYVVVGNSSVLYTSPDATTWTVRSVPGANNILSIAWTGIRFVTGGGTGTTRFSNDGITWTAGDTGSGGLGVVMYGNDMVVIGSTSAGAVYNSSPKYMFWAIA